MADTPSSFAEYLAGSQRRPQAVAPKFDVSQIANATNGQSSQAQSQGTGNKQDTLSWLVDILTRPLSGITNIAQSQVNRTVDARKAAQSGDVLGSLATSLGNNPWAPVGDFLSGLTSTDPNQHRTFSDVIEQSTDKIGSLDPKYVDEQNNVNPVLKGVAGLAGDIALDPLTWIPGAQIAKVATFGAKGAKAALQVGKDLTEGIKVARSAKAVGELAPEVAALGGDAEQVAKAVTKASDSPSPVKAADLLPNSVADQIKVHPRTTKMVEVLDDLARERPRAAPKTNGAPGEVLDSTSWWKEYQQLATESPNYASTIRVKTGQYTPRDLSFEDVKSILDPASTHSPALKAVVQEALSKKFIAYREAFGKAQSGAKPAVVDALSRPITSASKIIPELSETLVRQRERFEELVAQDSARVEGVLGNPLFDQLKRTTNPDRFDEAIRQMGDILRPASDLSEIGDLTGQPVLRKLFKAFDIDPLAVNASRRQAQSNVGKVNVNEAFDRMRDPKLGAATTIDKDVIAALPSVVEKNFFKLDSYKLETAKGTKKTEEGVGQGLGRDARSMNTHYQWDNFHALTDRATGRIEGLAGAKRAAVVEGQVMPALLKSEALLDSHGIPMFLDFGGERLPLSLGQSLEALQADAPNLLRQVLFNVETAVPTTNLLDAVFFAVKKDASWDVVNAQLAKVDKRNLKQGEIPNPLASGGAGRLRYGYTPGPARPAETARYTFEPHRVGRSVKGWYKVWNADVLRAELTDAIMRQVPRLKEVATQNGEAYAARLNAETLDLSQQEIDTLETLVRDPEVLGIALRQMGDVASRIQKTAFQSGTLKESSGVSTVLVESATPGLAIPNAKGATKVADQTKAAAKKANPKTAKTIPEAGMVTAQKVFDDQAELADTLNPLDNVRDWGDSAQAYRETQAGIAGKLDPLNRFLNYKAGMENVYDLLNNSGALHGNWTVARNERMNELARTFGGNVPGTETPILRQAFQDVQRGVKSSDPTVAAADTELSKLMGELVDLSGEAPILGNTFFRNNVGLDHLNTMLEKNGLPFQLDLDDAARVAKDNGTDLLTEASQQWKTWNIEDPVDFISRFSHSAMRLFADASVGQGFTRRAVKEGWAVKTPQKGYSRINNTNGSAISGAIPDDLYIRNDFLAEMKHLEEVMYSGSTPGGDLGKFVRNYFDPVQRAWKKGITVYRPGHHTRNLVGDSSATFTAEGLRGSKQSISDAFKVMQLRNEYEGVDIAKALQELGEFKLTDQGDVLSTGKFGNLTAAGLYDAAERAGLFRSARVVEDLVREEGQTAGTFEKLMDTLSLTGTRAEHAVMGVSEYREHYVRLQHFLQIINKAQKDGKVFDGFKGTKTPKNLDELMSVASERVKRYHPDSSMLSVGERTYMRRLIPFYSWFRGILPAIAETLVLNPGRVAAFPKASYNLAVAMGVNPDSLSDPFPTDQLFPSFLTDQMTGPQFKIGDSYFGINPGIAHLDVLNSLAPDPIRGVAGMISPVLRMPAELLSGGSWGTGAPIKDPSDYIDSSLPGINYLANISGVSPTGSIASLLGGQGLDPQYQVAAGNKGDTDKLIAVLNWLTGVGLNNQSRPNYINYAEIEKRNQTGQQGGTGN